MELSKTERASSTPSSKHDGSSSRKSRKNREGKGSRRRTDLGRSRSSLLCGMFLSVSVSCLLAWKLQQRSTPAHIDIVTSLNTSLRDALVGQSPAITAFIGHLKRAETAGRNRVDFLALGPSGTGKTLMLQALCAVSGVPARRLVGAGDIGRDLRDLDGLGAEIAAGVAADSWLILGMDDVSAYIPQVAYLTQVVAEAASKRNVRLVTIVTATSSDAAGERGVDAEMISFAHAHLLRFRPMRRAELSACVRRFLLHRHNISDEVIEREVLKSVKFEGQYAASGCKPAIYQLQSHFDLAEG